MSMRVTFIVDDGDKEYTIEGVPVPSHGARIELDGPRYDLQRPPIISYWPANPDDVMATVDVTEVSDDLT
jgi:hypothetical protein